MDLESTEWVFYRDRPEWKDVEPVPQDDGHYSVVSIAYSEKFRDVYDYYRGLLKLGELSDRALSLTKDALDLNPGNYSVWLFRRKIIQHLGKDLQEELEYTKDMIKNSEKNYQVWHHRRVIVEWANSANDEDKLTRIFLTSDPKNYHAWQHRQWYILKFNLFDGELEYTKELISNDVRNNSAWNQRYFVYNCTTNWPTSVIEEEVDFTISKIDQVRRNESSWNYLRGVMLHAEEQSAVHEKVRTFCEKLYSAGDRSPYLLAYLVDLCDDALERKQLLDGLLPERAVELCEELEEKLDKVRCQYWKYMKRIIGDKAKLIATIPEKDQSNIKPLEINDRDHPLVTSHEPKAIVICSPKKCRDDLFSTDMTASQNISANQSRGITCCTISEVEL